MLVKLLAAEALSLLGNASAAVVLPWLVLVRTGEAGAAGTVAAVSALPMLISAVGGGVLIDRVGRRRISVLADLGSAASVAALPVVDATVGLDLGWFVALAVVGALFDVPGMTAREALLPEVASASGTRLERAAGLREGVSGTVLLVGPGIGAGLLVLTGGSAALWLTAATSAAAALLTLTLRGVGGTAVGADRARVGADLAAGWAVLRTDRILLPLTLLTTASVAVVGALLGLVLPARLAATVGPGWLGAVITGFALGGIAGAGVYAAVGTRLTRRVWFVAGLLVHGAGLVLIMLLPAPWVLVAGAVTAGAGSGPLSAMLTVVVAERVPDAARGRVLGLQNALALAAAPVGLLVTGFGVDRVGVVPVGRLLAVTWCAATVVALAAPPLRRLEPVGAGDAPVGDGEVIDAHHR